MRASVRRETLVIPMSPWRREWARGRYRKGSEEKDPEEGCDMDTDTEDEDSRMDET
jgi:hypothetical protein